MAVQPPFACACFADHNSMHAADVMLNMHLFIRNGMEVRPTQPAALCFVQGTCTRVVAQARVSDIGVLCSLLAAAAHDYAHPARTNAFLVSTKVRSRARLLTAACAAARVRYSRAQLGSKARRSASAARTGQAPLAIRYNDKSVLESMHSAELFTIMQDADCNVLATLPEDQQRLVRAKARPAAVRCGVLGGLHCSGAAPSHSAAERTGSALADHLDDPRHRHGVPFQAPGRVQGQDA